MRSFDKNGFSLWRVNFKYNEELTQTFMSSNQIGGFFNRLEASRKYLFGSVGVIGTTNNSIIAGALIARGPEIKPVVEVAPDWESYTYERIDLDNAEQKAFFEAALAWDLEIGDKKWADGKNVSRPLILLLKLRLLTSVDSSSKCIGFCSIPPTFDVTCIWFSQMDLSSFGPALFLFFIFSSSSPCVFSLLLHVSPILPVYRLADIKRSSLRVVVPFCELPL